MIWFVETFQWIIHFMASTTVLNPKIIFVLNDLLQCKRDQSAIFDHFSINKLYGQA